MRTPVLLALMLLLPAQVSALPGDYAGEIAAMRAKRVAELTKPDGWLTLVGLHFLATGSNPLGNAADNAVVLATGPAHLGVVTLAADGNVTFSPAHDAVVEIDGQPARADTVLHPRTEQRKATLVACGSVSFFVIERNGRKALRVRNRDADRRAQFAGIDYFPTDPAWRVEAEWVPFNPPHEVSITNVLGSVSREKVPGKAVFQRNGKTYELMPIDDGPDEPLFFIFSDATSGEETYQMRFLDADQPQDGKVVLDFNLATNPPCAFTPFATCPLAPKENQLTLAVTAGEKSYRGKHD